MLGRRQKLFGRQNPTRQRASIVSRRHDEESQLRAAPALDTEAALTGGFRDLLILLICEID